MTQCEVCGGHEFRRENVEEFFHIDGRYMLVERIPATVCLQCGEKTFDANTAESLRRMLHEQRQPEREVALGVFAY
jgi:YgiT-type zinc finger domain-containing protein